MNMQQVVVGIVALVVIVGGFMLFARGNDAGDSMIKESAEEGTMQKEDAMAGTKDAMSDGGMQKEEAMMGKGAGDAVMDKDAVMSKGTYEVYSPEKLALASGGKVVLYFHADWCPICRPLDAALKGGVPAGIHILKVNYDTAGELKQKYGVTYQHTFVQVDASGKLIAKWGDAFTAADVFARIK